MKNLISKPTKILVLFLFLGLLACADLTIVDLFAPSNANAGQTINTSCTIRNIGDVDASESLYGLYLSRDPFYDLNDETLGIWSTKELAIGQNTREVHQVELPDDLHTGNYYLVAITDVAKSVLESTETRHNDRAYRIIEINGKPNTGTDLVATNVFHPTTVEGSMEFQVFLTVQNVGQTFSSGSKVKYYFSENQTYESTTDVFIGSQNVGQISGGGSRELIKKLTMPADLMTDNYYVIIRVDADDGITEFNEENNEFIFKIRVIQPKPDLIPQSFNVADETKPGQSLSSSFVVTNNGYEISEPQTTAFYLSKNSILDANDQLLDVIQINSVGAFSNLFLSHNIPIPMNTAEGSYYVFIVVDDTNIVEESDENNNYSSTQVCIHGGGNPIAGSNPNGFTSISRGVISESTLQKRAEHQNEIKATLKSYPNPTHDILNLVMDLETEENAEIVISDMSGKTLKSFSGMIGVGAVTQFDLSYLPAGTYIVHAVIGEQRFVEKVMVK